MTAGSVTPLTAGALPLALIGARLFELLAAADPSELSIPDGAAR
ncbi:MAG TPA: hypothetical protein VMS53_10520 [Burkholderiales bacterium]|nr:hypothetical protein [Burkholderiales bacterium]